MKTLTLTVDFTVKVPDDTDIDDLCLDIPNVENIRVLSAPGAMEIEEAVVTDEYLTVDVIDITEPSE